MNIAGVSVIVTGGASGLGLAFSRRLSMRGAFVWIVDRDRQAVTGLDGHWPDRPDTVRTICCDVGIEAEVVQAVDRIHAESDGVSVLVNNAAVLRDQVLVSKLGGKLRRHALCDWEETLRSNLTGTFLMAREVAASMIQRRIGGLIVNVSSISRHGNPGQSAYAASKGGIDALTVTWSQELAVYGIRVVGLAPGFVETSMTRRIPPLFLQHIRERTPIKRFGRLEEFAHVIEFVIENDYLNGKTLELDGGLRF